MTRRNLGLQLAQILLVVWLIGQHVQEELEPLVATEKQIDAVFDSGNAGVSLPHSL